MTTKETRIYRKALFKNIQQLKNTELSDYTFSLSLTIFIALLLIETREITIVIKNRQWSFLSVYKSILFALDVTILVLIIVRAQNLSEGIANFVLDPKGSPKFSSVFLVQHHFLSLVAISSFLHSFLLIHILSTLNAVGRK